MDKKVMLQKNTQLPLAGYVLLFYFWGDNDRNRYASYENEV